VKIKKFFFPLYQCNYPQELLKYAAIVNCYNRFEEFSISPEVVKRINELENQKRGIRELVINSCREYNQLVMNIKKETEKIIFKEEFSKLASENISRLQNIYWSNQSGYENPISKMRKKVSELSQKLSEFKNNALKINDICEQISKNYFSISKKIPIFIIRMISYENKKKFVKKHQNSFQIKQKKL
jgi:hypothetical protein